MSFIDNLVDILFNINTAFFVLVFGLVAYLILLDNEGAFTKKFLHFGPADDAEFINMKVDTWPKVLTVYAIGFFTALMIQYYKSVSSNFIHQYLWNPAYTDTIQMTKSWAITIVTVEQIIFSILKALQFFVIMTTRLQFILPSILGKLIIGIPYGIYMVNQNKFIK